VSARDGRLLRRQHDGSLVTHADLGALAETDHPWDEIVVDGRGNAYINNAGFPFPVASSRSERSPCSSRRHRSDSRRRHRLPQRNGRTPDNATLIVAESYASKLTAFDITSDGGLTNQRIRADLDGDVPDGICIDADGAVWYGDVPNTRCVRVREGGQVLDTIDLDRGCFACTLGGADRRTLFLPATEWGGTERMADGSHTGQLLTAETPAGRRLARA
jgi:sugar lactone lactonase YvrE